MPIRVVTKEVGYIHELSLTLEHSMPISSPAAPGLTVGPRNLALFIEQGSIIWNKEYRECVARGEEPPFDLEDLLRRYGSSPPNSEVSAPPSSAPARNPLEHSAFQRKDG